MDFYDCVQRLLCSTSNYNLNDVNVICIWSKRNDKKREPLVIGRRHCKRFIAKPEIGGIALFCLL